MRSLQSSQLPSRLHSFDDGRCSDTLLPGSRNVTSSQVCKRKRQRAE
jgi:hypothetical protein